MKKNINYTWNEDLRRVIKGDMPQEIEARQHDKNDGEYKFPKSEKWIATRRAREQKEREMNEARLDKKRAETLERQNSHSDLNEFGHNPDFDIPHNQNRASVSEIREDYAWQIPLGIP